MIAVSWLIASLQRQISIQLQRAIAAMVFGASSGGQSFCLVFCGFDRGLIFTFDIAASGA
jgi:hypothetical protein